MHVAWSVLLITHFVGGLLIIQDGHGREEFVLSLKRCSFHGCCKCGSIYERLEDGTCGPVRYSVVDLAGAITASAHQRQHLPCMRIEGHERYLGINIRLAEFLFARVYFIYLLIDEVNRVFDG